MSKLVLLQGGEATPYDLTTVETVLGRHPDCTIQLPSNMVSRRHARVIAKNGRHFVEDLGSGNGTFLNGQRITELTELRPDDRIKLGPMLLRYESQNVGHASTVDIPALSPVFGRGAPSLNPNDTAPVMPVFHLDVTEDEGELTENIVGSLPNDSAFGLLESQPEAKLKGILKINRAMAQSVNPLRVVADDSQRAVRHLPACGSGQRADSRPRDGSARSRTSATPPSERGCDGETQPHNLEKSAGGENRDCLCRCRPRISRQRIHCRPEHPFHDVRSLVGLRGRRDRDYQRGHAKPFSAIQPHRSRSADGGRQRSRAQI